MLFIGAVLSLLYQIVWLYLDSRFWWSVAIFFALNLMSGAMEPLKDLQVFRDYMVQLSKSSWVSLLDQA